MPKNQIFKIKILRNKIKKIFFLNLQIFLLLTENEKHQKLTKSKQMNAFLRHSSNVMIWRVSRLLRDDQKHSFPELAASEPAETEEKKQAVQNWLGN